MRLGFSRWVRSAKTLITRGAPRAWSTLQSLALNRLRFSVWLCFAKTSRRRHQHRSQSRPISSAALHIVHAST
jgi:hypothetical protein